MAELILDNVVLRAALLIVLFAVVLLGAYVGANWLLARETMRGRIGAIAAGGGGGADAGFDLSALQGGETLRRADRNRSHWLALVNRLEAMGIPLVDRNDDALRARLVAAGYDQPSAPQLYQALRLGMVVGLPALLLLMSAAGGGVGSAASLTFLALVAAGFGLMLPGLWIRARAARRQRALVNGFPDALDLMLVCVEAGLGLEAAFSRVGQEMGRSQPLLAEQFGAVVLELRAGRSHEDALRRMADRAGADEIRAFATLLVQSTKLGTSIAQTLRVYAAEMREARRMRAEEKAHRLPVLLSIPLVACMLPTMIGVLMLPAFIRVVRVLIPALHG